MIHWVTEYIGTSAWNQVDESPSLCLLDVRDLVDKNGNLPTVVKSKIDEALRYLRQGEKIVICCDYGMSRSNAIAAGVLAVHEGIRLDEAIRRVVAGTGETSIRLEVLSAVRKALGSELQETLVMSEKGRGQLLVTGASGFIGSTLLGHLKPRHEVITPTRQEVDLMRDLVNLDLFVKEKGVDTILHLANPRVYTTNESIGTALVMLKNVLDVCIENELWLIFLSGWEIYSGYKAKELRANEALAPSPGGTYGQTKFLCETLIKHYQQYYGIKCTLLRSSPVYGPGSDRPKFIWNFLHKAMCNEDIVTHQYLNGFPALDLLHVDDLCKAFIAVIEQGVQITLNIGTGVGTSTTEVAQRIIEHVSSKSKISHLQIDDYTSNIIMDYSRASSILGWHPTIELSQGLETILKSVRV